MLRWAAPAAAASAWFERDFDEILTSLGDHPELPVLDPWGSPWRVRAMRLVDLDPTELSKSPHFELRPGVVSVIYSAGPDCVDAGGRGGDDLTPALSPALPLAWSAEVLGLLAVTLVWWAACLLPARRSWRAELVILAAMAAPPCGVGLWSLLTMTRHARSLLPVWPMALTSTPVATGGSFVLIVVLAALGARLRWRPAAAAPDA